MINPLVIRIPGEFWDSQIYSGRMYLFTINGEIITLDWNHLLKAFQVPQELDLVFHAAFKQSNLFYGNLGTRILKDQEFNNLLESKFSRLSEINLDIDNLNLPKVRIQDNPYPFPHADSTIYQNHLYVVSRDGIFEKDIDRNIENPFEEPSVRLWDGNSVQISASYNTLAIAGGEDGLWQYEIESDNNRGETNQISSRRCDRCGWAYWSIYGSSYRGGFLAEFNKGSESKDQRLYRLPDLPIEDIFDFNPNQKKSDESERKLNKIIDADEVFNHHGYSWAGKDKIYNIGANELNVTVYHPYRRVKPKLTPFAGINHSTSPESIISADVSSFGAIVEYQDQLTVYLSDGNQFNIMGEVINWRVLPRSKFYENQLHVIFEDHLAIFSFNQDYFVDQNRKMFGMKVSTGGYGFSK